MRVLVSSGPLQRILQWAQRLFFAAAILLLGYCGLVMVDAWVFQQRESRILQRLLAHPDQASASSLQFRPATSAPRPPAIATSGLIGRLEIPRLALLAMVVEGTSTPALRRAVGHIPGTPLPGQAGNIAFTGHRD